MIDAKRQIKNYSQEELIEIVTKELGEAKYRAEQIYLGLYKDKISSFSELTTISKSLRDKLEEKFSLQPFKDVSKKISSDGSVKLLFTLWDDNAVEAVYMPWIDEETEATLRNTLCMSTQAGCALNCAFCATGTLGIIRNLETSEITGQLVEAEKLLGEKAHNAVLMGMGEPLQNYTNVIRALDILTDERFDFLTRKKMVLSTSGIVPKIYSLADIEKPVKLAISLHATTDEQRKLIMPIAKKWNLEELMEAVDYYYRTTRLPITFEYIPFKDFNDTPQDAQRLAKFGKRNASRINIIPFNDISFVKKDGVESIKLEPSERVNEFAAEIVKNGAMATVRDTFGKDIQAACGQLAIIEHYSKDNK